MKNIVNRALVAKKKQFQSKSVPRGTRTIWRYLGALFLIFTLGIGQMWGAEIFSTDVLASVSSATVSQNKGDYTTGTATSWCKTYENYFATSGSAGYYQLAFSTPISLTDYTDVKVNVYWGATSNRPLNMTINDGSATKIDEVAASADRSKLRVAEGAVSVSSISSLKLSSSGGGNVYLFRIEIVGTPSGGGGGDPTPVDPTLEYNAGAYTIGATALDLSSCIKTKESTGAITYTVKTDGGTSATITGTSFTAEHAGTCVVTASQAEVSGTYNATSADFDVVVSAPDPCTTYYHFVATADATANGKTNWDGFTNAPTGSNGQSNSVTIDGSNYTLTKRTGSTGEGGTILGFTIPANKAGTLYGYMKSSGTGARTLSLKKGDDVVKTNTEITDGNWTLITISAIAPGTYTLSPDKNVQIQMFALKVCDAEFHTITFDADGGSTVASISALDGAPATKPADPTKENADFVKWVVKSTGNDYDWASNVTGDLTLKAVWSQWPKLTLEAGEGATGDAVVTYHKAGSSVAVPAKPEGFSNGTSSFTGWVYSSDVEITDGAFPMPSSDLTLTAQWASATAVAQIVGGDSYETFAAAIAAVTDGQTIQLLQDIEVDAQIEIAGVDITIDLNGHKIEYVGDATLPSGVILVHNGASLTINDSSDPDAGSIVSGDKAYAAVALTKLGDDASTPATLVVNGGALTGYYYGITGNGSRNNTVITINGGTITGTVGTAIYNPQVGTLTVNNGTLTGLDAAIEMRAGTLVINDGTFTATATEFSCISNGSGSTTTGAAIAIAQHSTQQNISVTINGGTFNGVKAISEANPQSNPAPAVTMAVTAGTFTGEVTTVDVNNFISGGTFDHEVAANQCAEGYAPKDNGDGTYGVKPLAQTFSLEDLVTNQGTGANYTTYLNNLGWTVASADALDKLNTDKDYDNYPYLGLKFKNAAGYVAGEVEGGKLLTIKLGHMAGVAHLMVDDVKKMELDGVDAETPKVHYYYVENTANVKLLMANAGSKQTCVLKAITVADPFTVTFNANGGEDVASLNGTPTVTLPSATKGTDSFLGWFDGETKVGEAGDTYTPTANITLVAHWEAVSTDARLASISFSSDAGTLSPAFDPEVTSYTYTMPYGTASVPTITGATAVNANAQAPVIGTAATAWGEAQTIKGVAQSGDKKTYTITMQIEPKDGVSLVKIVPTSQTKGTQTGLYPNGDELTINLSSGMNLGGSGKYIGVKATENFQEGDVLHLDLNAKPNTTGSTQIILYAEKEATNEVWATGELASEAKDYYLTLPAAVNGHKELYIVRTDGNKWNGGPSIMEVTRAMNPVLTAITIDGRDGEIDALDDKHFSVTIPYESDLAALTVVPTVIRNAAHATTPEAVVSNAGAWILGDNTYRVMDKDGDYTDYTITLTRDVLKHTVSFNTHGGSAVANEEVVDGQKLAAAPADPTKDENVFKFWSETEDGAEVDVTTVQINADKEFHAVWEAEPAGIKLINGDVVNHTNFLTGTNETTVEIESVEHKCVDFTTAGSNRTTVASIADLKEFIQYNATTNKAKIKLTLYNTKSSAVSAYLHMLEEGSETPTTEEISIPAGEVLKTDFYEFNSEKNRSFYITCGNRDYIKVLQVKVIDDGTTTLKKAGQVGYSVNTLKSRIFAPQQSAISFEGLTINANAVCKPLSATALKIKNNYNISFHADAAMTLAVTTEGNQTYYVSATADGTTNETSFTGRKEFEITAGDWYIHASSELKVAKLEFIAPKCEKPTIKAQPQTKQTFGPGNLTATVVADAPSDGGTLKYQWYDAATDEEVENATEATLTTTTEGTYYVIVTNTLADHSDNSVKSEEATLGYRETDDATLSVLKYGETAIALEADKYEYRVDLEMGTTVVPTLSATATMAGYAEVVIFNESSFDNYEATSTVTVTSEDLSVTNIYKVHFYVDHIYTALVPVTGSTSWNWKNAATEDATINDVPNKGAIIANYLDGMNFEMIEGKENEKAFRNQNDGVYQGTHLHFTTTVPGKVKFYFRAPSSGENCTITVKNNGKEMVAGTRGNSFGWSKEIVVKGDVEIEMVNDKQGGGTTRVQQIVFTELTPDYTRNVSNNIGTLCVDHNVLAGGALGATFYQIASRNEIYNDKIDFEEVLPGEELKAGEPYIFQSTTGKIELFYGATAVTEPKVVRGMIGSFADANLPITEENKSDILYIAQNKLWNCEDLVGVGLDVVANRAYIVMSDVPTYAKYQEAQTSNPAPRRRVTLGRNAEQVATGIEDVQGDKVQCTKMLINGQLFILRGEKMYDAKGQLVK